MYLLVKYLKNANFTIINARRYRVVLFALGFVSNRYVHAGSHELATAGIFTRSSTEK